MVTRIENSRAFRKKAKGTSSRYRGVGWNKANRKWLARIQKDKKFIYIGQFETEEEAALAYNKRATELGFFPEALNKV